MLDVVLYGYDDRGLLTLQERAFASLQELARFFTWIDSARWQWAEVEYTSELKQTQIVKYQAATLRAMIMKSNQSSSMDPYELAKDSARDSPPSANSSDDLDWRIESNDSDSSCLISSDGALEAVTSTCCAEAWVSDYRRSGNAVILIRPSSAMPIKVHR